MSDPSTNRVGIDGVGQDAAQSRPWGVQPRSTEREREMDFTAHTNQASDHPVFANYLSWSSILYPQAEYSLLGTDDDRLGYSGSSFLSPTSRITPPPAQPGSPPAVPPAPAHMTYDLYQEPMPDWGDLEWPYAGINSGSPDSNSFSFANQSRAISPASSAGSHGSGISYPPGSRRRRRSRIFASQSSDALLGAVQNWDDGNNDHAHTQPPHVFSVPKPDPSRRASLSPSVGGKTGSKDHKRAHNQRSAANTSGNRVGKRRGPLRPEQRKQAMEIRKLRSCFRCKIFRRRCDWDDETCAPCKAAMLQSWPVPCTRLDIKDLGFFMKDWKADYEHHIELGFGVNNIRGFSASLRHPMFITHGYGQVFPIGVREVYCRDDQSFDVNWVEGMHEDHTHHEVETAKLSIDMEGIPDSLLSEYLDRHISAHGCFQKFVDDHFDGTPFLTQMLKTIFEYYSATKSPVLQKALKFVLAYNLTLNVTFTESFTMEIPGKIQDPTSQFRGKTVAPVLVNSQIKVGMANLWRDLHQDVLRELSRLYTMAYRGNKLQNWPIIFVLSFILLVVWEEMQFDSHYRIEDSAIVENFCSEMEGTPVEVIIGLFEVISRKMPSFQDWETKKHHHLVASDPAVCDLMAATRQHVIDFEDYLQFRPSAVFDRNDFDSLSNKLTSQLVLGRDRSTTMDGIESTSGLS